MGQRAGARRTSEHLPSVHSLGGRVLLAPSDALGLGRSSIGHVQNRFEPKLEGRVGGDRLLDLGQVVGLKDGVAAELPDTRTRNWWKVRLSGISHFSKMSKMRFWAASCSA